MADYKHRREDTKVERPRGDVVQDGYSTLGRRPHGAAPGNIVSEETASAMEDTASIVDDLYSRSHNSRRRSRLMRSSHDVFDDEPYLDYEG